MAFTSEISMPDSSILVGIMSTPSLWCKIPSLYTNGSSCNIFFICVSNVIGRLSASVHPNAVVKSPVDQHRPIILFAPDVQDRFPDSMSLWSLRILLLICKSDYFTLGHMISSFLEKFNSQSVLRDWLCINKNGHEKAD